MLLHHGGFRFGFGAERFAERQRCTASGVTSLQKPGNRADLVTLMHHEGRVTDRISAAREAG
jgi:hypothetical protein